MRLTGADWQALRFPLLLLIISLAVGAALVVYTSQQLEHTRTLLAGQQKNLREARDRLHQSGEEKNRILRFRAAYIDLQQRGFVGEEQRINWVDALRAASLDLKLFGVSYQIEAQQPHGAIKDVDAGPYLLQQSVMKISLSLLHEEDLMRFVRALTARQAGIFVLRECSLQRQAGGKSEPDRARPNLQAECSLAWLSIGETGKDEKP